MTQFNSGTQMKELIQQRQAILSLLYDARLLETKVIKGYVKEYQIQDALDDCAFNLGVLIELGQIHQNGYKYRITGKGVLAYEKMRAKLTD